jgi:hypothetical protein
VTEPGVDTFVRLETQVWQALVDGDAEADGRLLSDDFLGVYPSGFADRHDHMEQLANGPSVAWFELLEPRLLVIADDVAMLSYRADFTRPRASEAPVVETMFVSSLWCRRDGRWQNVFSQDTTAAANG